MSFLVYLFVLVVAACSVVFGLDWMQAPLQPPSPVERTAHAAALTTGAVTGAAKANAINAARPASGAAETVAASAKDGSGNAAADVPQTKQAAATPAPICDIAACERAYRSFTPADCTYQPSVGARRLCTRGNPPRRQSAIVAAAESHAQARCNVSACESAYQSFDAGTCTYKPYDGPRRLCTK